MSMGKIRWMAKQPSRYQKKGFSSANQKNKQEIINYLLRKMDLADPRGMPIYESEWDVLIVLDACRIDLLEEVSSDYSFIPSNVQSRRSVASCSRLWMDRNFSEKYSKEMGETVHVTSNPYTAGYLDDDWFYELDEVWKYSWDENLGTVPCRPVTDRAIDLTRRHSAERFIIHYLQPHFPSIPDPLGSSINIETFGEDWNSVWNRLQQKEVDKQRVWESYKENLRYVLDDVELLLDNIKPGKIVITADHANAFGEWGQYGHPPHRPISVLRQVPWIEVSGVDTNQYEPSVKSSDESVSKYTVEQRLNDLGYLSDSLYAHRYETQSCLVSSI